MNDDDLYVLLPVIAEIGGPSFVGIFVLAIVALLSHVPGGLGIQELVLVTMHPQT